ncbi:MAG TPA: hypothetical protein DF296_02590 [Candidatus Margulisbacteria bacterium]|nr:hypothetical protein [Candidatus Margulisiibacteriota bacterium]
MKNTDTSASQINQPDHFYYINFENGSLGDEVLNGSLERLQALRQFDGEPAKFWTAFIEVLVEVLYADAGVISLKNNNSNNWNIIAAQPRNPNLNVTAGALQSYLTEFADTLSSKKIGIIREAKLIMLSAVLETSIDNGICLATFFVNEENLSTATHRTPFLKMATDVPASYQQFRASAESKSRVEHFSSVLDLMVILNAEKRFLAAAMNFCNEIASRHKCDRVSLGWMANGYIATQAISHIDAFDRKSDAVQKLEAAMEEAIDQNSEIIVPVKDRTSISRLHEVYADSQDIPNLCSLPLRCEGQPVAVLTCERASSTFLELELGLLQLACDQATRVLADLKLKDRWFGARLVTYTRSKIAKVFGFDHVWTKLLAILITIALGVICFGKITYRVQSPVIVRTDSVAYLSAPFDGHIEKVNVRPGDSVVTANDLLVFDRSNLLLEKASRQAEQIRYEREYEKAMARRNLADMRIAESQLAQIVAQLSQIDYRLDRSLIRSPIDGVLIEGDLLERLGEPVKQGDVLFKVAKVEDLYAELEVDESDIHDLKIPMDGEVAFASRPQDTYKIDIFRVEPAAVAKKEGNVFVVHARFQTGSKQWWRPGMTGISKINIGKRTILWVFMHRTVDFLRLRLWW